jgi:hypothetical protein
LLPRLSDCPIVHITMITAGFDGEEGRETLPLIRLPARDQGVEEQAVR